MSRPVSPPPQGLPGRIRFAAAVCLVLSGLTGLFALTEALGLGRLSEMKEAASTSRVTLLDDPALNARLSEAQYSALEGMRESRSVILTALAVTCAFAFVSASRMLRPDGLPLERIRKLLGGAAIAAAALRTMDGAQIAVVARRMGHVLSESMSALPELKDPLVAAQMKTLVPFIASASTVLQTVLVAGTFAVLGQYFRSERVRQVITAQDGPLEED